MTISSGSPYTTKDGEERRYASYGCCGRAAGDCTNAIRVAEDRLRKAVIDRLRQRLLIPTGERQRWLDELRKEVRQAISDLNQKSHDNHPAMEDECKKLRAKCAGWAESLANPTLPVPLRAEIEARWTAAKGRADEIERSLRETIDAETYVDQLVDDRAIVARLDRLADVLQDYGPTIGNLELSFHIDSIRCAADGTITLRMCKLGALSDAIDILNGDASKSDTPGEVSETAVGRLTGPRRRGRLRTAEIEDDPESNARARADFAADTHRFAGLDDCWFWTDSFRLTKKQSWAESHAEAVFGRRQEGQLSLAKLAEEFDVTKPTIRAAIRHYLVS